MWDQQKWMSTTQASGELWKNQVRVVRRKPSFWNESTRLWKNTTNKDALLAFVMGHLCRHVDHRWRGTSLAKNRLTKSCAISPSPTPRFRARSATFAQVRLGPPSLECLLLVAKILLISEYDRKRTEGLYASCQRCIHYVSFGHASDRFFVNSSPFSPSWRLFHK
jgi:hypothetical protein